MDYDSLRKRLGGNWDSQVNLEGWAGSSERFDRLLGDFTGKPVVLALNSNHNYPHQATFRVSDGLSEREGGNIYFRSKDRSPCAFDSRDLYEVVLKEVLEERLAKIKGRKVSLSMENLKRFEFHAEGGDESETLDVIADDPFMAYFIARNIGGVKSGLHKLKSFETAFGSVANHYKFHPD